MTASEPPILLVAMKEEAQAFPRRREGGRAMVDVAGRAHELLICGVGEAATAALDGRRPKAILQVGFAGALRPDLEEGALLRIVALRRGMIRHDLDGAALEGFAALPSATLVTAPAPLGAADKARMHADRAGDLVDMESFHVFNHCRREGIPWRGIRVVSDTLAQDLPEFLRRSWDGRRFRLAPILSAFLLDRRARREILELRDGARRLSARLAEALVAG